MARIPYKADPLEFVFMAVMLLWPVIRWGLALMILVFFVIGHWFTALGCFILLTFLSWWLAYGELPRQVVENCRNQK
ncbi:hypothetical protein [Azohydromonas australica]|uniref:hypothetical protein n=1 Tax=Azohydromonas australica TaxID=364039 RepID=UPI0003F5134E|nr:hypothetical protein [Azohydromonas australica]